MSDTQRPSDFRRVINQLESRINELQKANDRLRGENADLRRQLAESWEKYNDLIYEVRTKVSGESAHDTAKRIIRQHEHQQHNAAGEQR